VEVRGERSGSGSWGVGPNKPLAYYIFGIFIFIFSLNPFPPFLHIIVVVSPVSCLFLVDHLDLRTISPFSTLDCASIMKTSISSDVWEKKKALISKLYMEDEWPLKQVIKQIRTDDFNPR
jgi:hypothetical protein